jgi:hypothetical protein
VCVDQLRRVEGDDAAYAEADQTRLADAYDVNLDWLSGRSELCDHAAIRRLDGGRELPFRTRDMIAEVLASLPQRAPLRVG